MKRRFVCIVTVATVLLALSLGGCAPADTDTKEEETKGAGSASKAPADDSKSSDELASLIDVDTSAVPAGPNVDALITIEEVQAILGRTDVFIAVPAG